MSLSGTCVGLLAYTKPRLAAKILAAGVLLSVPSMTFMAVNLNRWSTFAGAQCNVLTFQYLVPGLTVLVQ